MRGRFSTGRDEAGNWEETGVEKLGGGQWQLVVSEIPYMLAKGSVAGADVVMNLLANADAGTAV